MDEIITALREILTGETATGGALEGMIVADDEHELPEADEIIVISPINDQFLGRSGAGYEASRAGLFIIVLVRIDDKNDQTPYKTASQTCRQKAALVRKVILDNGTLSSTSYPQGLVSDPDCILVIEQIYGYGAENGVQYAWTRIHMTVDVKYRNGTAAIS